MICKQKKINVLYVDDETGNLNAFKAAYRRLYNVYTATTPDEGRKLLKENKIHVVITDQRMPNEVGSEFLQSIIEDHPDAIRMLLTGYADLNACIDAVNKGQIYRYLTKPWDVDQLQSIIDKAYQVYKQGQAEKQKMKKLVEINKQLEFQLMQSNL